MAYSLVPDANNTVGSDLTAMYDNFVALESAQIVDSGSTADGDYWRFEDGLQVCVKRATSIAPGDSTWNFPAAFSQSPTTFATLTSGVSDDASVFFRNQNYATSRDYVAYAGSGVQFDASCNLLAMGWWK